MKAMHKLFLVFACLVLLTFCGCTDKKEAVQPEPGWQVIDFVWAKENSDKMTLSVTVPEEWDKSSVNTMLIYGKEATTQIENSVPYYSVSKWSSNTKMLLLHFHAP